MSTYYSAVLACAFGLLAMSASAQEETGEALVEANSDRAQRIQELRQELRQEMQAERESRRERIEERLANLSEDERAALREKRRMIQQNQARRAERFRRLQRVPCDCGEAATETESEN